MMLLFFSVMHESTAQKYLAMDKSSSKRLRYYQGDEINVRLKRRRFFPQLAPLPPSPTLLFS
jgi:hypothetical protein